MSNPAHGKTSNGKKPRQSPKYGNDWGGFVNIPLNDADKARIVDDDWEPTDYWQAVTALVESGYKVSFTADPKHNCYIASITGKYSGTANDNYGLSARGPDLAGAFRAVWYKHAVLAEGAEWAAVAAARSSDDAWG